MLGLGRIFDLVSAFAPLDLQTARDGDYVSLKNAGGVDIVVTKGAGTAADDPVISFQQAVDVAGTSAKDLATITQHWQKQAATDLTGTGVWTRVTQAAGASVTLNATSAEEVGIYVFTIEADQLDVDNGFDCLRVRIADVGGNAQLGTALYILRDLRYPSAPQNLPNAIID